MKWLLIILSAVAQATPTDPYLLETKVQRELNELISRIIRKEQYVVLVHVEIGTYSTRKIFEAEMTTGSGPEVVRKPAAEVTAGFVPDPNLLVPPPGPSKEERQVYRFVETPNVEKLRVQIQVDDKLPEKTLNQARAIATAYLSGNYPQVGKLHMIEVAMLHPLWWEVGMTYSQWLGWIGLALLLVMLVLRRRQVPVPAALPTAAAPIAEVKPVAPVAADSGEKEKEEMRKRLLSRVVARTECFRSYYQRLTPENRSEVCAILKGPAFDFVCEKLRLEKAPQASAEIEKDRLQWHEKNFSEFMEMSEWQDRQPFGFLTHLNDEQLVALAQQMDTKTVCIMLRFLKPNQAAMILDNFPQEKRLDILSQVSAVKSTSFTEISALEHRVRSVLQILPSQFFGLGREDSAFWGQVLGESKDQVRLAEAIEQTQSDMQAVMKKLKFQLEEAAQLDKALLEKVLGDLDNDVVAVALASCNDETVKFFLDLLPEKRREFVEAQITSSKSLPKDALQMARQTLTNRLREHL